MTIEQKRPAYVCYVEIPAPQLEKSGKFYKEVFGWKITHSALTENPYWVFNTGERQLEGGLDPGRLPSKDGGVILYLRVDEIEPVLTAAKTFGGLVVRDKFAIGAEYGFSAVIEDPSGNQIGVFSDK